MRRQARGQRARAHQGGGGGLGARGAGLELIRFIPRGIFSKGGARVSSYPEPLVARVTGVNRHKVAEARKAHLVKGDDWTNADGVVSYTPPGLKKLLGSLGLGEAPFAWPNPANAPREGSAPPPAATSNAPKKIADPAAAVAAGVGAAAARPIVDLRVTALSRNPTILHASADGGRTVVLVRVRTNENFIAGMPLKARPPGPGGTLYFFEGHCPRWKGRY